MTNRPAESMVVFMARILPYSLIGLNGISQTVQGIIEFILYALDKISFFEDEIYGLLTLTANMI
jgi:hypothetical protein